MQKKILLPLILIIGIGGVTFAAFLNPKNLPDTAEFPRIPMGSGTIGEIIGKILGTTDLGNYASDGTVNNTQTLSGRTASGYLKNNLCTPTQVWTGFDATGTAKCNAKSGILSYFGTISSQDCGATLYRADGTSAPTTQNMQLKAGDIIKTNPGCGMTIAFVDTSILRLDGDTTASLDISTNSLAPTKPIASLILESGQVWGRILSPDTTTSTGYTIGSDEVVAGVRGTSIAVYKGAGSSSVTRNAGGNSKWKITSTNPSAATDIAVVHSRIAANMLTGVVQITAHDGTKTIMNPGDKISYNNTPSSLHPTAHTLVDLYGTTWISDNTKKDLDYMKILPSTPAISNLGSNPYGFIRGILNPEQNNSTPGSVAEKNALCETTGGLNIFWTSLIGTDYDKCQSSTLLAFEDFSNLTKTNLTQKPMYFSTDNQSSIGANPVGLDRNDYSIASQDDFQSGYKIEENGEYISYGVSSLSGAIGGFSGKTITLTLSDPVGTYARTGGAKGPKFYIADFGTEQWFMPSSGIDCGGNTDTTGTRYLCRTHSTTNSIYNNELSISFTLSKNPNQVNIGNFYSLSGGTQPGYWNPIGTTIKKITIN